MCVIVLKPKNIKVCEYTLSEQWAVNDDGAGLAFWNGSSIIVEKGYMDLSQLHKRLRQLKHYEVIYHLRYATHGKVNKYQTHPFMVSKKISDAKGTDKQEINHTVIFHNGVISGYGNKKISDTIDFTCKVLSQIRGIKAKKAVLELTGSKYALMQNESIHLIGEFYEYGDLMCSNLNWTGNNYTTKKSSILDYWADENGEFIETSSENWENFQGDCLDPDDIDEYFFTLFDSGFALDEIESKFKEEKILMEGESLEDLMFKLDTVVPK